MQSAHDYGRCTISENAARIRVGHTKKNHASGESKYFAKHWRDATELGYINTRAVFDSTLLFVDGPSNKAP